ncbi:hypothetical protein Tco_1000667 [Tanacetum coccineum]
MSMRSGDDRVEGITTTAASLDAGWLVGRMIEEIDQDVGVTLVTPTQGEDQPKDQFGVLSTAKVLVDAAKTNVHTYTRRRMAVSTSSGRISTAKELVSTAGVSMPVSTADMVQEVNISIPSPVVVKDKEQERLGHEAAMRLQEELDEEKRQRMAKVHEAAQSFTKEEWENIRARVEADKELSRRLQAEEMNKYRDELFETIMKNANTFVPMETKDRERASKLAARSSQATIIDSAKVGSSERAAEVELNYEGSKRQKTNEASGSVQEQPKEEEKELSREDLQ